MHHPTESKFSTLEQTEERLIENTRTIRALRGRLSDVLQRLLGPSPQEAVAPDAPRAEGLLDRLRDVSDAQSQDLKEILAMVSRLEQSLEGVGHDVAAPGITEGYGTTNIGAGPA